MYTFFTELFVRKLSICLPNSDIQNSLHMYFMMLISSVSRKPSGIIL